MSFQAIKIVDFGESFMSDDVPDTLHTPIAVRAPEVIFGEKLDLRMDLWSMGSATRPEHPGYRHIVQLLDHFELSGPNGTQNCFVLEVLRPIVPDLLDARFRDERLTGKLAKDIAKQALLGLDYLHQQKIGHGGGPALLNSSSDISYAYQICTLAT
ncbi:kinase-like protein [Venturia nashicola]|uniref:non-specific serine/threonine protein kinase n=1 Tax=Venturia nashicola TaxID=86259 RepID=A0A4Z1NHB1_9PEZI|nr:kinase-like protein [Venturia nashicola]